MSPPGSLAAIAIAFALAGCTGRQAYDALQGAREIECHEIPDARKHDACMDAARETYDSYGRRRTESRDH